MEQVLTLEQIEEQFDDEWILVGDPETNEQLEVVRGAVLHHSKDRDEVYRKAIALKPQRCAFLYTGELPENVAVIL